jgi:hypothetical protein
VSDRETAGKNEHFFFDDDKKKKDFFLSLSRFSHRRMRVVRANPATERKRPSCVCANQVTPKAAQPAKNKKQEKRQKKSFFSLLACCSLIATVSSALALCARLSCACVGADRSSFTVQVCVARRERDV